MDMGKNFQLRNAASVLAVGQRCRKNLYHATFKTWHNYPLENVPLLLILYRPTIRVG
jgi:hypothetical protein